MKPFTARGRRAALTFRSVKLVVSLGLVLSLCAASARAGDFARETAAGGAVPVEEAAPFEESAIAAIIFLLAKIQSESLEQQAAEKEPQQTPYASDADEWSAACHADPASAPTGPICRYVAPLGAALGAPGSAARDVALPVWNAGEVPARVRVQGYAASGAVYEGDRLLLPGEHGDLVAAERGGLFAADVPSDVEWIVIGSDRPLLRASAALQAVLDPTSRPETGWSLAVRDTASRTLHTFPVRPFRCDEAPWLCAVLEQTPWPRSTSAD